MFVVILTYYHTVDFNIISLNVFIYYPYCAYGTYLTGLTDSYCTTMSRCLQTADFKLHKKNIVDTIFKSFYFVRKRC